MSPVPPLILPTSIALVPGANLATKFADARRQHPHLPDLRQIVGQLVTLSGAGGVPVIVDPKRNWVRFYASRFAIGARRSQRGDAYIVEFVEPIDLRQHERLAAGTLRIVAPAWYQPAGLGVVPPGCHTQYPVLRRAWTELSTKDTTGAGPVVHERYERFCDGLETVIEAGRQIEAARRQSLPTLTYYRVESAAEQRRTSAGTYVFFLARPGGAAQNAMVEVRDSPDLRGKVYNVDGERLTVRFEGAVHRPRIPAQGELVLSGSDLIPRVQLDAVNTLRAGAAAQPRLLHLLVDGTFTTYPASTGALPNPSEPLDPDQLTAFRRALRVPDLSLVVGPPGTGKTRTIVEIARACAARGERVLITSQTNTAVDNVIERLPPEIRALRAGGESRISERVQPRTIAALATGVQREIVDRTAPMASRLGPWLDQPGPAAAWLTRLDQTLTEAAQAYQHQENARRQRHAAVVDVRHRYTEPIAATEHAVAVAMASTTGAAAEVARLGDSLRRAKERETGILGVIYRPVAARRAARLVAAQHAAGQAGETLARARRELDALRQEIDRATAADPRVQQAEQLGRMADAAIARVLGNAVRTADQLRQLLAGVVVVPAQPPDTVEALRGFHAWCDAMQPVLRRRAALLRDWRQQLAGPTDQLHAELVRYADVIGATCIGVAVKSNLLTELDFDLVIVDEAGQIPITATLVPLVRARRAVLVGDHHQLPPFVDDEVRGWLARQEPERLGADPERLVDLLTKSAFERMIARAPDTHQVLLTRQRRMPETVADFVSAQFYAGRLRSDVKRRGLRQLFTAPLAVLDTADRSRSERAERERGRSETWQVAGYENHLEAQLIIDLVQWYARTGGDWAVIVPYRAQVDHLRLRLGTVLGDERMVRDNVGTVDAFQGAERDLVVYGFTRSNNAGRVGFLAELRRLNVAITRAREQLVLVGDFTTLRNANHPAFRRLARDLHEHAAAHGDVRPSGALRDTLARLWQEER